jgi:epoxyqueuosine reductase
MYFLGEIFTSLPLEADAETSEHCGSCNRCMQVCPTQAIIAPNLLDAQRCISYLTIENPGVIPEELRSLIGNRIYGCDDCQLFCPWNKFAPKTSYPDFSIRHQLDSASLLELFMWDEDQFKQKMAGSAIHRIGYQRWQRNLAVGLGNSPYSPGIVKALNDTLAQASDLVAEHIRWALLQQINKAT